MVGVLFVCMGNICRSPSAWGVFLNLLNREGLSDQVTVDSAGTHGYHVGGQADPRSMEFALKRGVDLSNHRARQVHVDDFDTYDYILAMDMANYERLKEICPNGMRKKVHLFMDFAPQMGVREVPDPYYGGATGFEHVLDLVEAASEGLLADIRKNHLAEITRQGT